MPFEPFPSEGRILEDEGDSWGEDAVDTVSVHVVVEGAAYDGSNVRAYEAEGRETSEVVYI